MSGVSDVTRVRVEARVVGSGVGMRKNCLLCHSMLLGWELCNEIERSAELLAH